MRGRGRVAQARRHSPSSSADCPATAELLLASKRAAWMYVMSLITCVQMRIERVTWYVPTYLLTYVLGHMCVCMFTY